MKKRHAPRGPALQLLVASQISSTTAGTLLKNVVDNCKATETLKVLCSIKLIVGCIFPVSCEKLNVLNENMYGSFCIRIYPFEAQECGPNPPSTSKSSVFAPSLHAKRSNTTKRGLGVKPWGLFSSRRVPQSRFSGEASDVKRQSRA